MILTLSEKGVLLFFIKALKIDLEINIWTLIMNNILVFF